MGQFTAGRRILQLDQIVYVNDVPDARIWCESISKGSGCGGTTADFSVPELLYDSYCEDFKDALVRVFVFPKGGTPSPDPDYTGCLLTDSSAVSPQEDRKAFSSHTITALLNKIEVGQEKDLPTVHFPLIDPVTLQKTNMKPLKVLQDIFGTNNSSSISGGMPSSYRARVDLGNTHVLNDTSDVTATELTFNLCKVDSAIDQILACYGDVAYRERFSGTKVYLDFYRVQEPYAPRSYVRISQFDDPKLTGALVQQISNSGSSAEAVTRVQGFGSPILCMVSCKSYVASLTAQSQSVVTKRLQRVWDAKWEDIAKANPKAVTGEKSQYTVTASPTFAPVATVDISSGATSFVIAKPPYAIPAGSIFVNPKSTEQMRVTAYTPPLDPEIEAAVGTVTVERGFNSTTAAQIDHDQSLEWQMPGLEFAFRRYRLPKCFEQVKKRRDNALKGEDGKAYPVQVWLYKAKDKPNEDDETTNITVGTVSLAPTLVEGAHVDLEKNEIILAKPALEKISMAPADDDKDGDTTRTYQETVVGVTFTFEAKKWLKYDTGQPVTAVTGLDIDADGLIERWKRDELVFSQHTSANYPLLDENGAEQTFGCVVFDQDDDGKVTTHAAGTPVTIQDDSKAVKTQCEEILRERNMRPRSYNTTLPLVTRGYDIGQALEVLGEANYSFNGDKITSVELNMPIEGDHSTVIVTDNVKPPHRRQIKKRTNQSSRGEGEQHQPKSYTHSRSGYYQRSVSSASTPSMAASEMGSTLDAYNAGKGYGG